MTYASMKYGGGLAMANQPLSPDQSGAANGAVTGASAALASSMDPENPMLWLVGIGAVTLGLVAFSTHVRVGKISAGLDAGTP